MRSIATAVAAALTGLTAALVGIAAPAQAADGTVIVTPVDGDVVAKGADTITVRFGATDSYEIDVEGAGPETGGYSWYDYYDAAAGETQTFTIDPANTAGPYEITVWDGDYDVAARATFEVAVAPVKVTNTTVRPAEFYPVVRDRYRDTATVGFTLNRRADVTAQVYRVADGKHVRSSGVGRGTLSSGRHQWTWNGLTNAGKPVKSGRYRIEIEAQDADGHVSTGRATVMAETKTVTKHATEAVNGNRVSSAGHRGNCYANRDSYFGEIMLDCWGGAYAQASYRFAIPANAADLRWHVNGQVNCCDRGRLIRTGQRISKTSYRIDVKVTYWRSFTVSRASVSYTYTKRI